MTLASGDPILPPSLRHARLLELLQEEGWVSVDDAVRRLGVSPATARRDFTALQESGLLERARGGVVPSGGAYDLPVRFRETRSASEKIAIAELAATLITSTVVGMNGGTTCLAVARALASRAAAEREQITLVTTAINIAAELVIRPYVKVIVCGGAVRTNSYEVVGPWVENVLGAVNLDWAVIGVDALDAHCGASAASEEEASVNATLAARARHTMVVADSTKIGKRAFTRICGPEQIHTLVTDAGIDADDAAQFRTAGVDVRIANN